MLTPVFALLAGAATFFLTLAVLGVLSRAWARYQERYLVRSINDLGDMFLFVEPGQIVLLNIAAMILLAAFGYWLGGPLLAGLLGAAGFFSPPGAVKVYRARRLQRFNLQLTDALQQMANALRAGLTFAQAVEQVGKEAAPPLRQEFGLYVKEVKLGVPIDEALVNMAARVGSEDLELVATSSNIARGLGGNMAEMFETIAATIRERFRLEGKIASLTSQGKMQGLIVSALPLVIGLFLGWYRPDLMEPMFERSFGYILVSAVVLLETIGFLFIRRIVSIDV
ncbi:MAG TPA: type II secretion system F family protein [Myxococcales bacterium]|jgi:tight adherence protein B|nr:type II secretion system F family protein [Myxococcales bacterium]